MMRIRFKISDSLKEEFATMKNYSFGLVTFIMLIYLMVIFYFGAIITIILTWLFSLDITSLNFSILVTVVFSLLCIEEFILITSKNPTLITTLSGLIIKGIYTILRQPENKCQKERISQSIEEGFLSMMIGYFAPSKYKT